MSIVFIASEGDCPGVEVSCGRCRCAEWGVGGYQVRAIIAPIKFKRRKISPHFSLPPDPGVGVTYPGVSGLCPLHCHCQLVAAVT